MRNYKQVTEQRLVSFAAMGTKHLVSHEGTGSSCIRECGSTLYVGMVRVVSFSLYMGIGAKSQNRLATAKTSPYRAKHTTDIL